jgi:ATP-dependent Clp protease ATP-binding subunit ClpC
MDAVKRSFRPEFVNRIDNILVFRSLQEGEIAQIANLLAADLQKRLAAQEITLELDESVGKLLAEAGFDAEYGARPLKRAIVRLLEDPLSEALLAQEFKPGDTVWAYAQDGTVKFSKDKPEIKSEADSGQVALAPAGETALAAAENTENTEVMQENAPAEAKDSSKDSDKDSDDSGKDEER